MKNLKKIIRLLCLVLLIALACAGVGAPINFNTKEDDMDSAVKIVQEMHVDEEESVTKRKNKSKL